MGQLHGDAADNEQAGSARKITAITRRDIFDHLRSETTPWCGRLDEVAFLEDLYDLDALPSNDQRPEYATARLDIFQHRLNNYDWDDEWIFKDPRFELLDGPDKVLLNFLARMVHPEAQPDVSIAARQVDELNRLLTPDGWMLRTHEFLSGRPVYAPVFTGKPTGPMIPLPLGDDDASKLDLVLGQTHRLLDAADRGKARDLLLDATLTLRPDGGYYNPVPGDNWRSDTYEAVLTVDPAHIPEFTPAVIDLIWKHLSTMLIRLNRDDVQSLEVESALLPLPPVTQNWRQAATTSAPTNQASRERKRTDEGYPTQDDMVFGSQAELAVYQALTELQRDRPLQHSIAILPLPAAKLRDTAVRHPDFIILGSGHAVIIEVDGPQHYGRTRKADDEDRDRHWNRCGIPTIRIAHEHTADPTTLRERLREDLTRTLIQRR